MADPGPRIRRRDLLPAGQLAGAWACGSVLMGTVALLFVQAGYQAFPLVRPLPGPPGTVPSFFALTPLERLAVLGLVAILFIALAVLSWRTAGASWLTGGIRARLLWAALVGVGGLAGWSFAAVVTFAAGFGHPTQLILAYLAGGLPFALTAAMLQRSWQVNVAAIAASFGLVAAGFLMLVGHSPAYPQDPFTFFADYARSFFSGPRVSLY